jgi:transaldolase
LIKIFLDTADIKEIEKWSKDSLVSGFTTNPSLACKSGVMNYREFIKTVLEIVGDEKPISFEVLSEEDEEIERQARLLAEFGKNIYVKIPLCKSNGQTNILPITNLSAEMKINVTAVTSYHFFRLAHDFLFPWHINTNHIISIFAGRISDCGVDPEAIFKKARRYLGFSPKVNLLWASTREVFNIYQADRSNADTITCTPDLLKKYIVLRNKNLDDYGVETSRQFYEDGQKAGLTL